MLATLWLVGLSLPMLWAQRLISCPYKNVCQYALLSGSDVILQCNYPKALWYFSSSLEDKLSLVNSKPDGRVLPGSDLQLSDPKPSQTGLYRCLDNHKARLVEYEIDFQNIALLHITHKDLGQEPMGNESMNLGGKVLVFTRWDPWQDCNRCQKPGERKRLGYCYVEEPQEKPMPCWLYLREEKVTNSRLRPELQLQACQVPCDTATETNQPYFVFDTYLLDKPNSNARLKCPLASIYRLVASTQPSSQSTMLTILWTLLSSALPVLGPHTPVSCPKAKECFLALLSSHDVLLECTISDTNWLFSRLSGGGKPVNLSSVSNIRKSPEGGLHIHNPLPSNTGLYQCLDKYGTQVTSYKIDFQDITKLHATHTNLGQKPLMNETLNLSHREVVYTQWGPWQRCNNCGRQGERKRLGYCYIKEPLEEPVPCGLYLWGANMFYARIRPEMQVEICFVGCQGHLTGGDYVIFDNFKLTEESGSARLTCPFASIYRPVHWEADNSPLTWQDQLSGQTVSTIMDLHSGGQHLKVFQPATYRCFVEQELIAQFNPTERQSKAQNPWQPRIQPDKADSVLRRLKLMVLSISVLAVGGLLCKVVFRPVCGKKRSQVLLVK